jgi:hypothetical protein
MDGINVWPATPTSKKFREEYRYMTPIIIKEYICELLAEGWG